MLNSEHQNFATKPFHNVEVAAINYTNILDPFQQTFLNLIV